VRVKNREGIPPLPQVPFLPPHSSSQKFVDEDAYIALHGHHSGKSGASNPGYTAPSKAELNRYRKSVYDWDGNSVSVPIWEGPYAKQKPQQPQQEEENPPMF
jgi:hypothetical protein